MNKISVIIPIYNVEAYLENCLNSIILQTYTNLEIILIDDGSKDLSSRICDEFSIKDKRIKVIHMENRGQSFARNYGLEIATGEYISFVDADDYLDYNFYKCLIDCAVKNDADIVACDYKNVKKVSYDDISITDYECVFIDREKAIKETICKDGKITNFLWNKLYKKKIWKEIKLPSNNIYEDLAIMYKILDISNKIYYIDKKLYYYLDRKNSSSNKISTDNILNKITLVKERESFLKKYNLDIYLQEYRFRTGIYNFKNIARNKDKYVFFNNANLIEEFKFIKQYYNKNKKELKKYSLQDKILIYILVYCKPMFYYGISLIFGYN